MFDGLSMTPFLYRNHSWSHHRPLSSCDAGDVRAPITGALCCFPWNFVVKSPDRCAGLVGNYKSKVLFEKAESDDKGETTVLQNQMHPSQQKFFDFLGKHISLHSVAYLYCNVGLELRPICDVGLGNRPFCFEIPISLFHVSF